MSTDATKPEPKPKTKKAKPKTAARERRPGKHRDSGDNNQQAVGMGDHVPAFMRRRLFIG